MFVIKNIETGKYLTVDDVHEMHYARSRKLAKKYKTEEAALKECDENIEEVVLVLW